MFLPPPCNQSVGGDKMGGGEGVEESPFSVAFIKWYLFPAYHSSTSTPSLNGVGRITTLLSEQYQLNHLGICLDTTTFGQGFMEINFPPQAFFFHVGEPPQNYLN